LFSFEYWKATKGIWVKNNDDNYPPKIHNLIYLHDAAKLDLEEALKVELLAMNAWNLEGRYPEYKSKMSISINKQYIDSRIEIVVKLKSCLREILQ
jgi:hypothetical protein